MTNINEIFIVGLGLIGTSFVRALKRNNRAIHVVGFDANSVSLQEAFNLGFIDEVATNIERSTTADLIIIATPMFAISDILLSLSLLELKKDVIVTDVGSVKNQIVKIADELFKNKDVHFVPGHPIAGSEKSGLMASKVDLFVDHKVILTPLDEKDIYVDAVKNLWQDVGANVEIMDAAQHDNILAATSHLPHLLAFALVDCLAKHSENLDIFKYAAGGFRDFTRISASDPTMWRDIFLLNGTKIFPWLDEFILNLESLKEVMQNKDEEKLFNTLKTSKNTRDFFQKIIDQKEKDIMQQGNNLLIAQPSSCLHGEIQVPGDKSISHRTVIFGAISEGITTATGFLQGEDTIATANAFKSMGVKIEGPTNGEIKIYGVGLHGLKAPNEPLYLGNSGTSMRLLCGLLAAQNFDSLLTGDISLSKRPMNRVVRPLREMGAEIDTSEDGRPPIAIKGKKNLLGITYEMPIASAQVKSCLLLAGLYAKGKTTVIEPSITRDHTERMLKGFGCPIVVKNNEITVTPDHVLVAQDLTIPSDFSSATFFIVAALIAKEADITIKNVGINPTRTGALEILRLMGANIELINQKTVSGETTCDVRVKHSNLNGIEIPVNLVSLAIDEFPVLFIAAACAKGKTILRGAGELRVKESDRILSMAKGLTTLGIKNEVTPDGIIIEGGVIEGGTVESFLDHRIAMSFAVASVASKAQITILDTENIATSFPNFTELANSIGMNISG